MSQPELNWLEEQGHRHKTIVEIGVFQGRSTSALCIGGNRVIAIDSFAGTGKKDIDEEYYKVPNYELIARKNLAEFLGNNLTMIKGFSSWPRVIELVRELTGGVIDFLFIDGDHDFIETSQDIMNYGSMIRPGGIISGHDFHLPSVRSVVEKLVPGFDLIETIWFKVK